MMRFAVLDIKHLSHEEIDNELLSNQDDYIDGNIDGTRKNRFKGRTSETGKS